MNGVLRRVGIGAAIALLAWSVNSTVALADDTASSKVQAASEATSSNIRDYLSDPRRTGSLAGSILGGALLANPAGPIVGSVIGFFVGKSSMYNEEKARAQQASLMYAKRDIVPQDGQGATLSLANGKGIRFDSEIAAAAVPSARQAVTAVPGEEDIRLTGFLREQLVEKCGANGNNDPRLRSLCFYLQGG